MKIPKVAMDAIKFGVTHDATIADLTFLGLPLNIVQALENHHDIFLLKDLLNLSKEKLHSTPNLQTTCYQQVIAVLSRYHELGIAKEVYLGSVRNRAAACKACNLRYGKCRAGQGCPIDPNPSKELSADLAS